MIASTVFERYLIAFFTLASVFPLIASFRFAATPAIRHHGRQNQLQPCNAVLGNRLRRSKLEGSRAVETEDSIAPTVYEDDLYGILGVPMNATRAELRDAYWSIAFNTHPDRNNTPEALSLFRNASYAYKILGRDEKARAEYDSKLKAKMYVDVIDQLSRDVIKPLAMEVAVPLINMTVRGIGSIAVPFFKDAIEQSTAVYEAAFLSDDVDSSSGSGSGLDFFTRAAKARTRKSLEQKIRKTQEGISSTDSRLASTESDLVKSRQKETQLKSSLDELESLVAKCRTALEDISGQSKAARLRLESAQVVEKGCADECAMSQKSLQALMDTAASLAAQRQAEEEEVRRLEAALVAAKEKVRETIVRQAGLEISISLESKTRDTRMDKYKTVAEELASAQSEYKTLDSERDSLAAAALKATRDRSDTMLAIDKEIQYSEMMTKRLQQLATKKASLEEVLDRLQSEWELEVLGVPIPPRLPKAAKDTGIRSTSAGASVSTGIGAGIITREGGSEKRSMSVNTEGVDSSSNSITGSVGGASSGDSASTVSEIDGKDRLSEISIATLSAVENNNTSDNAAREKHQDEDDDKNDDKEQEKNVADNNNNSASGSSGERRKKSLWNMFKRKSDPEQAESEVNSDIDQKA